MAQPDPEELRQNLSVYYGAPPDLFSGADSLLDIEKVNKEIVREQVRLAAGTSQFSGIPVSASVDDYFEMISLETGFNPEDYNPQYDQSADFGRENRAEFYEFTGRTLSMYGVEVPEGTLKRGVIPAPESRAGDAPAKISVVPTSTTNPEKPRTVAAGYDGKRQVLTVVFRDGTFYNYYDVTPFEWGAFKRNRSKGRYIYMFLDSKPRGVADVSNLSEANRKNLYALARGGQIRREGVQHGRTAPKRKTRFTPYTRIYRS